MYAIIQTGGKQYKVEPGMEIFVEKLNLEAGNKVNISEVLLVVDGANVKAGNPYVSGATVTASIAKQGKAKKIIVFKYKAKKGYKKTRGHRQPFTKLTIDSINA